MTAKKKKRHVADGLRFCEIQIGSSSMCLMLYFETPDLLVCLNNVSGAADLGPLINIKSRHVLPEALICVIPKAKVIKLKYLG